MLLLLTPSWRPKEVLLTLVPRLGATLRLDEPRALLTAQKVIRAIAAPLRALEASSEASGDGSGDGRGSVTEQMVASVVGALATTPPHARAPLLGVLASEVGAVPTCHALLLLALAAAQDESRANQNKNKSGGSAGLARTASVDLTGGAALSSANVGALIEGVIAGLGAAEQVRPCSCCSLISLSKSCPCSCC